MTLEADNLHSIGYGGGYNRVFVTDYAFKTGFAHPSCLRSRFMGKFDQLRKI